MTRVLHFHFGKRGGAERFFVNLANALGRRGVAQSFVVRPDLSWRQEIEALGPIIESHYRLLYPSSILLGRRVARLAREWRPDAMMAWMPPAARLIPDYPDAVKIVRLGAFPRHIRHFMRCDVIVGNVPAIAKHCVDLGWEGPATTVTNFAREVVPRPVARDLHDTPDDAFLVACAGRFVHKKGLDTLIDAVARVNDAWLWLIGDGEERGALERQVKRRGIGDRTRFVGWVEEPVHHVAAADVFGMPSRHEPLGNSILDAWRAGIPVVSTRSEGPEWFMDDDVDGLLSDIEDVEALAANIKRVRDDEALCSRLRAGGAAKLNGMFAPDRIVDAYMRLFGGDLSAGDAMRPVA